MSKLMNELERVTKELKLAQAMFVGSVDSLRSSGGVKNINDMLLKMSEANKTSVRNRARETSQAYFASENRLIALQSEVAFVLGNLSILRMRCSTDAVQAGIEAVGRRDAVDVFWDRVTPTMELVIEISGEAAVLLRASANLLSNQSDFVENFAQSKLDSTLQQRVSLAVEEIQNDEWKETISKLWEQVELAAKKSLDQAGIPVPSYSVRWMWVILKNIMFPKKLDDEPNRESTAIEFLDSLVAFQSEIADIIEQDCAALKKLLDSAFEHGS